MIDVPDQQKKPKRKLADIKKNTKTRFYDALQKDGYVLTDTYIDSRNKLTLLCPRGHHYHVSPSAFVDNGSRCRTCQPNSLACGKMLFMEELEKRGYTCHSEYMNVNTIVNVCCSKGHWFDVRPQSFRRSKAITKCRTCKTQGIKEVAPDTNLNQKKVRTKKPKVKRRKKEDVLKEAKDKFLSNVKNAGYELMTPYIKTNEQLTVRCPEKHIVS